jgi:hypothetical protein
MYPNPNQNEIPAFSYARSPHLQRNLLLCPVTLARTEQCVANVSKISGYEKEVMLNSEK